LERRLTIAPVASAVLRRIGVSERHADPCLVGPKRPVAQLICAPARALRLRLHRETSACRNRSRANAGKCP
jgi:hypothetical protein